MREWLTIDPGISGTGWAQFMGKNLLCWGIIRASSKFSWSGKAHNIAQEFRGRKGQPVFCEWPSGNFSSNAGIAAKNTDAILKLCFLIGELNRAVGGMTLLPVQTWKGQLPKKIVQARAERFFKQTGFKSHSADAVGMGQYVIQAGLL